MIKTILLLLVILVAPAWAIESDTETTYISSLLIPSDSVFTISITDDGQLELNGKPIDRMSDPEIKETMMKFRGYLEQQQQENWLIKQYDRQTEYLLKELERCLKLKR